MSEAICPEPFSVCIFITNGNKILGVTRKDNHSDWGLPGGKIDPGEGPLEACIRELKEETGLTVKETSKVYTLYDGYCLSPVSGIHRRVITYITELDNICGEIRSSEEGLVDWVTWGKLTEGSFGYYNACVLISYTYSIIRSF